MIPGVMVQDLIGRTVEIWVAGGARGVPTFTGELKSVIVAEGKLTEVQQRSFDAEDIKEWRLGLPVAFLVLRDQRGLEMRIPAEHVMAVVHADG